jgi:hypothetical protein
MDRPTRQPLTDLSRLSLTKEQLIRLREQRQKAWRPCSAQSKSGFATMRGRYGAERIQTVKLSSAA